MIVMTAKEFTEYLKTHPGGIFTILEEASFGCLPSEDDAKISCAYETTVSDCCCDEQSDCCSDCACDCDDCCDCCDAAMPDMERAINLLLEEDDVLPIVPSRVIFSGPATIALWPDGEKSIVKCQPGDEYDAEKGLMAVLLKYYMGNDNTFNDVINSFLPEREIDPSPAPIQETTVTYELAEGCTYLPNVADTICGVCDSFVTKEECEAHRATMVKPVKVQKDEG